MSSRVANDVYQVDVVIMTIDRRINFDTSSCSALPMLADNRVSDV